jgi:hypothetical protein
LGTFRCCAKTHHVSYRGSHYEQIELLASYRNIHLWHKLLNEMAQSMTCQSGKKRPTSFQVAFRPSLVKYQDQRFIEAQIASTDIEIKNPHFSLLLVIFKGGSGKRNFHIMKFCISAAVLAVALNRASAQVASLATQTVRTLGLASSTPSPPKHDRLSVASFSAK